MQHGFFEADPQIKLKNLKVLSRCFADINNGCDSVMFYLSLLYVGTAWRKLFIIG